jgi:hypothetical protein
MRNVYRGYETGYAVGAARTPHDKVGGEGPRTPSESRRSVIPRAGSNRLLSPSTPRSVTGPGVTRRSLRQRHGARLGLPAIARVCGSRRSDNARDHTAARRPREEVAGEAVGRSQTLARQGGRIRLLRPPLVVEA